MTTQLLISEQITYSTVRIECETTSGGRSTGTGYFFRFLEEEDRYLPAIVTNKHVVANSVTGRFIVNEVDNNGDPVPTQHVEIYLDDFEKRWRQHPDPNVDLAAMPIAPLQRASEQQGKPFFYVGLDKKLLPTKEDISALGALEDVVMVGYPNGIWDSINNQPILRRGVTATHPARDYNGQQEFMIDVACFPGSSGSPVFLYNVGGYSDRSGTKLGVSRLKLLGTLYAGPQYSATGEIIMMSIPSQQPRPVAISNIPINLGLVIKSSLLLDFEALFANK